jgi:hypothetical protein
LPPGIVIPDQIAQFHCCHPCGSLSAYLLPG